MSITITENVAVSIEGLDLGISVYEAPSITENVSVLATLLLSVNDSISISESYPVNTTFNASVFDAVTCSENIGASLSDLGISLNDTVSLSEYAKVVFPGLITGRKVGQGLLLRIYRG
jgi:hypothetical protein